MLGLVMTLFLGCDLGEEGACQRLADITEECTNEVVDQAVIDDCEASIEPCSVEDERAIGDFFECAFVCDGDTGATKTTGFAGFVACFAGLEGVSEECLASAVGATTPSK